MGWTEFLTAAGYIYNGTFAEWTFDGVPVDDDALDELFIQWCDTYPDTGE